MTYVSSPLTVPEPGDEEVVRLDLQVFGVDHREASYEVRVFLNQPNASADTPLEVGNGYAGSYYVFGHGGCVGDAMHCHVPEGATHRYDVRPAHKLTPQTRTVRLTEAWRRLDVASPGEGDDETLPTVTVSLVPTNGIDPDGQRLDDAEELLIFDRLAVVAYG